VGGTVRGRASSGWAVRGRQREREGERYSKREGILQWKDDSEEERAVREGSERGAVGGTPGRPGKPRLAG
jgi:hypothetical protein